MSGLIVNYVEDDGHPCRSDDAIREEVKILDSGRVFSPTDLHRQLEAINDPNQFGQRPPEVRALLAQAVLKQLLRLENVRTEVLVATLGLIRDQGLYVPPIDPVEGISPAGDFEQFVAANVDTNLKPEQAAQVQTLLAHGTNQHTTGAYNCKLLNGHGNSAAYLGARLLRDHPSHHRRWQAGEFRSVRAAAIDAGIITAAPQLILTRDPVVSAQRIREQRSALWIEDLLAAISEHPPPPPSVRDLRDAVLALSDQDAAYLLESILQRRPGLLDDSQGDADEGAPPLLLVATNGQNGHHRQPRDRAQKPPEGLLRSADVARICGIAPANIAARVSQRHAKGRDAEVTTTDGSRTFVRRIGQKFWEELT